MDIDMVDRAAAWAGLPSMSSTQLRQLERYEHWLRTEAAVAGGIGPEEGDRLTSRHIGDSLVLAAAWRGRPPATIVDLGSGVGLPGIPLAVVLPSTAVLLVDRSTRRCDLSRRAARILGLNNVCVEQRDIARPGLPVEAAVSRAAIQPAELLPLLKGWLTDGGVGVVAGSSVASPGVAGYDVLAVPPEILDREVWILIMARPREDEFR